jgi:linoleoyl-CoA desaturase
MMDQSTYQSFGKAIDEIRQDVESRVGEEDLRRVKRLRMLSRGLEIVGRTAIHLSFEPFLFTGGVIALWLHKQLEATEIGHTALHGAYDRFGKDTGFHSSTFHWRAPIDEEAWRHGHNVRHHGNTNVAGKDPDIHFGPIRLTEQTPWRPLHRIQMLFVIAWLFPNFAFGMNLHFTGVNDLVAGNGRGGMDFLPDRSPETKRRAWWQLFRSYGKYYAYEYGLFPALAGPMFWKVILGNFLSEVMRDVYSAATIFCGHVGWDVADYPEGDKAKSRGEWYVRQIEATNNFEVSAPLSVLCGGLDRQIEHHLFPKLAPARLREIAPAVRAACEAHGVHYRTASWPVTLKKALTRIADLSSKTPNRTEIIRAMT